MKFFSAILVAVFCATAISAAPQSSQLASKDFTDIVDKLKEHGVDLKCIHNVIGKVVGNSELKGIWDETKTKLDHLTEDEWQKCMKLEESKQYECMVAVYDKGAHVFVEFVHELANEKHWSLMKELKEKVLSECFENGTIGDELKEKFRKKFNCVIEGITEATKDTTFAPIWAEYVKHLDDLHKRVMACTNKPNPEEVARCIINEVKHDEEIRKKFFEQLKKVKKDSFVHITKHVKGKCFQ